jgi:hypothetical protein
VSYNSLNIDDVEIVGGPVVLAMPDDVNALESRLWIEMPRGYREYVIRLGEGILGGTFVRIYPPWRIEKEIDDWRRRISKYWFWDDGSDLLPRDRARECLILGDTLNGDELVFHPGRPNCLFVLPRDSERIFDAGRDLLAAVGWMCGSGELTEPFSERHFEPFDSRKLEVEGSAGIGKVADPEGESLEDIMMVARRWAERHGAQKTCQKQLKRYASKGKSSEMLYEAIILNGDIFHPEGYTITYSIIDKASKLKVGVFSGNVSSDSSGSSYEPR